MNASLLEQLAEFRHRLIQNGSAPVPPKLYDLHEWLLTQKRLFLGPRILDMDASLMCDWLEGIVLAEQEAAEERCEFISTRLDAYALDGTYYLNPGRARYWERELEAANQELEYWT